MTTAIAWSHADRLAALRTLNWSTVGPAVEEARAAKSKLRALHAEAFGFAFYRHLDAGSAESWSELPLEEREAWVADTPYGFFVRVGTP